MTDIVVNDSASGLVARHEEEDLKHIREVIMTKLGKVYPSRKANNNNNTTK